ncbi:MAG TPA: hypothetical protein PLG90_08670 [Ignavibacteria bacterium]|nr:hypothetical protein [Ignavibacteria bacterium]
MKKEISEFSEKLSWYKNSSGKRIYELKDDKKVFATIIWLKDTGTLAEASSQFGKWTFKRAGFFKPYITIRKSNEPFDFGVLKFSWTNDSELQLKNGKKFYFSNTNLWRQEYGFKDINRNLILRTVPNYNKRGSDGFTYYNENSLPSDELFLLITLSWYIISSHADDENILLLT